MCKILAFTDVSKLNLKKHVNKIGNTLLETERDGFGYAVTGKSGVFGEKTTAKTFRTRLDRDQYAVQLPIVKRRYCLYGKPDELTGGGIFHGRTSTNSYGLRNTHPMVMDKWHLIHNGVVDDHGPDYQKSTDNDSEDVLKRLIEGIGSVEQHLEGYYAFAALDPEGRMHVARDQYATLYMAWSSALESYIFATTETLMFKINKLIGAEIGPVDEIQDNVYMIFEGNNLVFHKEIKPLGYSYAQARHSARSLGTVLTPSSNATTPAYTTVSEEQWKTGLRSFIRDEAAAKLAQGGEIIEMSETSEETSDEDADWKIATDLMINRAIKERDERDSDDSESDYYKYRKELDTMDDSYQIFTYEGKPITPTEFYKMDFVSQEMCTIIRGDGTVVDHEVSGGNRSGAM